jgi:hypothetical protein
LSLGKEQLTLVRYLLDRILKQRIGYFWALVFWLEGIIVFAIETTALIGLTLSVICIT